MRIDVRHSDDRGKNALVGLVVIAILTKLWLSGDLAEWLQLVAVWFRGTEGLNSATYVLIELLVSAIYGVGAFAVLAWSGLAWLVRDIADGIRQWRERDRPEPLPSVQPDPIGDPVVDAIETLAGAVKDLAGRVEAIEAKPATRARR
jgi:hypothetical protein